MCVVKTPKIRDPGKTEPKDLPVLRNPFLDGISGSIRSIRIGRNALRIDRASSRGPLGGVGGSSRSSPTVRGGGGGVSGGSGASDYNPGSRVSGGSSFSGSFSRPKRL